MFSPTFAATAATATGNHNTIFTGIALMAAIGISGILKLTMWNWEFSQFDKIQLAIEKNMIYEQKDQYLFLDPITGSVIKRVQQPNIKDPNQAKIIYLIDCLTDGTLHSILKKKYDRVECAAWIKLIFFFLFLSACLTLLSVFRAHLITALAWAFTILWVVGPIAVWGIIFQFNVARAAKKLKILEETYSDYIYQYALFRLSSKEFKKDE